MPANTELKHESRLPEFWRRLLRNRSGVVGLVIITFYLFVGLLGVLDLTPFPPLENHAPDRLSGPSSRYIMGTDLFGRDVASRIIEGTTNSLRVAIFSVALSGIVGIAIGITAGFLGGHIDNAIMRLMDILFAFPVILLALLVVTVLGAGLNNTIIAISIVYTPIFTRVARGPVLFVKEMEFVLAARAIGTPEWRILLQHILPNTTAPLIVQISLGLSLALLTEAGLSFLGLGTQPPQPSWGVMLSESRGLAEMAPWLMIAPGAAIMLGVLGFNLLGDGLRDVLDPRLRHR
ncbi:MAG: ABC transporter permease [Chloroflexi bacterium]|nr:MAG: ABC transporter permease [Chloroflexota bacterium]